MVRTQIQLTEAQSKILHEIAALEGVSVAELIRRAVDSFINGRGLAKEMELIERAKEAAGKYRAGKDLAENHDRYLAEDLEK